MNTTTQQTVQPMTPQERMERLNQIDARLIQLTEQANALLRKSEEFAEEFRAEINAKLAKLRAEGQR